MANGRKNTRAWAAVASLAVCFASTHAGILYVRTDASGANTGASWEHAFQDLQSALAAARTGDEVWVASGVYTPAPPGSPRTSTFLVRNSISLFGGFAGAETRRDDRNVAANPTILSGDLLRDDLPGDPSFAGTSENAYHVLCVFEGSPTIDGFIIEGGRADGVSLGPTPLSHDQGSGANVYDATPTFRNCVFRRNWAINHGTINDHGSSTVADCHFQHNYARSHGAGLYMHHHSQTRAMNCVFTGNRTDGDGAGLYCASMHHPTIQDCVSCDNVAARGAGMYVAVDANPMVERCICRANNATIGGGGIYIDMAFAHVMECTFEGNHAGETIPGGGAGEGGSGGGGIWSTGGVPIVEHCTFNDNVASFGGGYYAIEDSRAVVRHCTFTRNRATEAGGLYTLGSPLHILECTFLENDARGSAFSVGGGVSSYFSNDVVERCTFIRNTAFLGGGGHYAEGEAPVVTACTFIANATTGHQQGWGGGSLNGYFTFATIENCAFVANTADVGGGVYSMVFAEPRIVNCTFAANHSASIGGALFASDPGTTTVVNSIAWGNSPDEWTGNVIASFSCVRGGSAGTGNQDVDPRFVRSPSPGLDDTWGTDDDLLDLRLRSSSMCIDAGDASALRAQTVADLAGVARRRDDPRTPDRGLGAAPVVDLGAFEFVEPRCVADLDDGTGTGSPDAGVSIDDMLYFLELFAQGRDEADVDDGTSTGMRDFGVTVDDLLYFLARYEAGC
jgi:hypothetical protein